jgi:hypothetical protein
VQELGEFNILTFPRDLALVCVDQKSVNILLATPLGIKIRLLKPFNLTSAKLVLGVILT